MILNPGCPVKVSGRKWRTKHNEEHFCCKEKEAVMGMLKCDWISYALDTKIYVISIILFSEIYYEYKEGE